MSAVLVGPGIQGRPSVASNRPVADTNRSWNLQADVRSDVQAAARRHGAHSMHILIVLTSHDRLGDSGLRTGSGLQEFCAAYYVFRDADAEVTLASPASGQPPMDPRSDGS